MAGNEPTLHVWDISEHSQPTWPEVAMHGLGKFSTPHSQFSYSADGRLLAATSLSGVNLHSPETFEVVRTLTDSGSGVRCSPVDPNLIAVGFQESGTLALFHAASGDELRRVTVLPDRDASIDWRGEGRDAFAVFPVRFSLNGERLMVMARMQPNVSRCVIYRVPDLREETSWIVRSNEVKESPTAALSSDGARAIVTGLWGSRLLTPGQRVEDAEVLFQDHHMMNGRDYAPDGRVLALGGYKNTIFLVDSETGQTRHELLGHIGSIGALRFSPDGKRLASASGDGVKLWDVATRRELLTLEVDSERNSQIEWSPDGNTILVMSGDGAVRCWRVPSFEDIESAP